MVPILIQNAITNFISLLDNVMVGQIGTEQMSGVSIVNQFIFIFNLLIYGAISGAGIFCVQYHGNGDQNGIRHTFRFKLYLNIFLTVLSMGALIIFDEALISTFLFESDTSGDLALTLSEGLAYLKIMLIKNTRRTLTVMVSNIYSSSIENFHPRIL